MRGEDAAVMFADKILFRITPACAGKTLPCSNGYGKSWDHPRMRGEDLRDRRRERRGPGSPPHARGRPTVSECIVHRVRITPACAGKTHYGQFIFNETRDHPRMRGEDKRLKHVPMSGRGSPPHARGRRARIFSVPEVTWITPACAGKTPSLPGPAGEAVGSPPHARGRRCHAYSEMP